MPKVMKAEQYRFDALGSFGNAEYMLIRQFQFPYEFNENEKLISADHDRCLMWDYDHARRCFKEHLGTGELGLENWLSGVSDDQVMNFLKDILKADKSVSWTGYRIMGTVNRSNGYPVYTLSLFAKDPNGKTEVYSSNYDAPNIDLAKLVEDPDNPGQLCLKPNHHWHNR